MHPMVLVSGAGPVGLTMAAELARYGVAVRIVDKAAERTDKSKALVLWSRSLELIDRMGCGEAFVAAGLKAHAVNIIAGKRQIAHVRLDVLDTPHRYALMLPQSETERLMEQQLNRFGVQVERRVELTAFTPQGNRVTSILRDSDGREETVQADWLIGCDGAHSAVRHGLGMGFEGETLASDWALADVHLAGVPGEPDEINMFWHSDGALALIPISPGRYRVIADVGDAGVVRRADPSLAEVQALLDRRGPGGIRASAPIWLAAFRINERKVKDYRVGRVFLAGDAAHIHSPAGGQGMNTGMQDAFNLAWKLGLVCRSLVNERLLDSYSVERSEVGRQVLANAGRLTTLAVLRGGVLQTVRNHIVSLVFGLSAVRSAMTNTLSELSVGYPNSPLTHAGRHRLAGPGPGERAPIDIVHPVGAGDTPLFALFATVDDRSTTVIARHRDLLEPTIRPPFEADCIWLVRPDGYVALVTRDWAEVESWLAALAPALA